MINIASTVQGNRKMNDEDVVCTVAHLFDILLADAALSNAVQQQLVNPQ